MQATLAQHLLLYTQSPKNVNKAMWWPKGLPHPPTHQKNPTYEESRVRLGKHGQDVQRQLLHAELLCLKKTLPQ
jgi:hypothetical protein